MSAVVYVARKSVNMLETSTRAQLYDSVGKFWNVSRRIRYKINPNITFLLREIRNCLKKIKNDETKLDVTTRIGRHLADAAALAATKDYIAALASVAKVATVSNWYT